jgi:biopolymer transport protein ExbB/TolQ
MFTSVVMFSMTAAVVVAVWMAYRAGKQTVEAKSQADELAQQLKETEKLVEQVKLVEEVKHEVAAMDDDELRDAGYRWVRNRPEDGRAK